MPGVVLPVVVIADAIVNVVAVDIVNVRPVVIVYVSVVDVDVDIVATPSATVTPAPVTPDRSHRHAKAKRNKTSHQRGWIVNRGIRIDRRAIDHRRVVGGNVNHFRAGRLNRDIVPAVDLLGFHDLLLAGC
jgi:transcriptional regulator of NAD metabolism